MKSSNTVLIEEKAVTKLEDALHECDYLKPQINKNDKTPSWDGEVFVYERKNFKKEYLMGRVPVQVKGTERKKSTKSQSFRCQVADLRNYYKDGGCMFFLVCMSPLTNEVKIYYSTLHVLDLKRLLDKSCNKKTIPINLDKFPQDNPTEIKRIFKTFVINSQKQKGFINKEIITIEDIKKKKNLFEFFSFSVVDVDPNPSNIDNYITTHEHYLYAKLKDFDIEIPVDKITISNISKTIPAKVLVKEKEFFPSCELVYDGNAYFLHVGKSICITIVNNEIKISFTQTGTLNDFIRDASCFVAILENQEITIGNSRFPFDKTDEEYIKEFKDCLRYYNDIKRTLDILGVVEDLNYDLLSDNERVALKHLVNAILYNRKVKFSETNDQIVLNALKIGNLSILLFGEKDDTGNYQVKNFFDPQNAKRCVISDAKTNASIQGSLFLALNKEAFAHASNMAYEVVRDGICELGRHPMLKQAVSRTMLNILGGYDIQDQKDQRLLDLAEKICGWFAKDTSPEEYPLLILNQLQIEKRRRNLSTREIIELGKLTDEQYSAMIRCGAFLLLDDSDEAQRCFNELPLKDQEIFLDFPICHFGKLTRGGAR